MKHKALVRFLNKEEGGRFNPPLSGYRPQMKIGDEHTSCLITPINQEIETMEFGVDYEVNIDFQFEENFYDKIKSGLNIGLYEGSKLIGHGYLI